MPFSSVEAFAPATVANLGVGFDILGLALTGMGDRASVAFQDSPEIVISKIEGDAGKLPREPEKNVASVSASAFLEYIGEKRGLRIELYKGLPLASGLGSSAASAVVTVVALNKLYGEPFSREQLLPFCLEGEALVSGYHADNVAPCLLGGYHAGGRDYSRGYPALADSRKLASGFGHARDRGSHCRSPGGDAIACQFAHANPSDRQSRPFD